MTYKLSKLAALSFVVGNLLVMPVMPVKAQTETFPYKFCTYQQETPSLDLTNAIAKYLNARYQGGVDVVASLCAGTNPRGNKENWIYTVSFASGATLDVAIADPVRHSTSSLISIRDGENWTEWANFNW